MNHTVCMQGMCFLVNRVFFRGHQLYTQSNEEAIDKLFIYTPDELAHWGSISVVLMIACLVDEYYSLPRNFTWPWRNFLYFLTVTTLHMEV